MSLLLRSSLVLVQAFCNQVAFTPPNKTPAKWRYHTEESSVLQIAPLIFKVHTILLWLSAAYEVISAFHYISGSLFSTQLSSHVDSILCPAQRTQHLVTPVFLLGVMMAALGMFIRVRCFHELGHLFTFDLTMYPEHKLVTSGFYKYVRHPAYTGSLLLVAGIAFSHLTPGSWIIECGILGPVSCALLGATWWAWALSVGVSRAYAEDSELRKLSTSEWDAYAAEVKFWFVPGLL
jgi:protein-S-isoprenylcysteine O-methyltransferase Ste14